MAVNYGDAFTHLIVQLSDCQNFPIAGVTALWYHLLESSISAKEKGALKMRNLHLLDKQVRQ